MPHGTPDWGLVGPKQTTYGLDDVGEAVARLGSPHVWDRRGDVISVATFRDGIEGWAEDLGVAGDVCNLSAGISRFGSNALRTYSTNAVGTYANWYASIPYSIPSGFGAEMHFMPEDDTGSVGLRMIAYLQGLNYYGRVHVNFATGRILYYNAAGVLTDLGDASWVFSLVNRWHVLKMVLDIDNLEYERVILDSHVYPMAGLGLPNFAGGTYESIEVTLMNLGSTTDTEVIYFDGPIITQNEPLG